MPARRAGQHARERTKQLAKRGLLYIAALLLVSVVGGLIFGFTSWAFGIIRSRRGVMGPGSNG